MRKFSNGVFFSAIAMAAAFSACSSDSPFEGSTEKGAIELNLSTDGRVMRATRAEDADAVSAIVPRPEDFSITLAKIDGSYSKSWGTLDGFNRETSFPIGDYNMEAVYTAPGVSVTDEGFGHAVFKGVAESVRVSPSSTTNVSVTATLANSMVSVRYTDNFKANFSKFNASVQTPGHNEVSFARDEARPAYINPADEVKVNLNLEDENGKQVALQPGTFEAKPRHHYVITFNVDSKSGDGVIEVLFEEDVVAETIEVGLGDLWTAPAPTIKTRGFEDGGSINLMENSDDVECAFDLFAFSGIKSASINLVNSDYYPLFGSSAELVNASPSMQGKLAEEGVDCAGLYRNVDKMAVVDLSKFLSRLSTGTHEIQVKVVDNKGRTTETPASVAVTVSPVEYELSAPVADFLANEVTVSLSTNCEVIKDKVKFLVPNDNGQWVEADVKSVTSVPVAKASRGSYPYTFTYVLAISPITGSTVDVKAVYGNKERELRIDVDVPDYSLEIDPFATLVKIKVNPKVPTDLAELMQNLDFYNDGMRFTGLSEDRDLENGIVTLYNLTPGQRYDAIESKLGKLSKSVPAFFTEASEDVPNGAFTQTHQTINIGSINAGGEYKYGATTMTNHSSILVSEPVGWASINEKTCYLGSDPKNTWFMVPSTLASNGEVLIRSVAYDHHGTMPDLDNHGLTVRAKYSRNVPKSFASKSAGELFLGTYSFNGTETRVDGISFASRPASMTFRYKYEPISNEHGEALVEVLDAAGNVIASGSLDLGNAPAYVERTIPLSYSNSSFGKKCATLRIGFKSAKGATVAAPVPSDIQDVTNTTGLGGQEIGANNYKSLCVGSQLWINNVALNYDFPAPAAPGMVKASRKARR